MISTTPSDTLLSKNEEIQHYPLAFDSHIRAALNAAKVRGDREFYHAQKRIDTLLKIPLFAYRPLPAALRFHQSPKKYRWALGGNRSSKSASVAVEVLYMALGVHPFRTIQVPNVGWYCTITWEMCGSILGEKLEQYLVGIDHHIIWRNRMKGIPDTIVIPVKGGGESRIILKAYEQGADIFQGTNRRYIADDEQFSQAIFTEQVTRIGPGEQLDFFAALTPIKPQPWLEQRLTVDKPEAWEVLSYPLDDNRISRGGYIPDSTIDAAIAEWPEEIQETRRNGKWGSYLGAVYQTFNRDVHVIPHLTEYLYFNKPKQTRNKTCVGAIDWGGANPFCFLFACQVEAWDNAWYVFDEYYWDNRARGVRLIRKHAEQIKFMAFDWKMSIDHTWSDHDRQDRFELENAGVPSYPAVKDDRLAGVECVQTKLKVHMDIIHPVTNKPGAPHLYIAERCRNLIRQLSTLQYQERNPDHADPRDDAIVKRDDHAENALCYLIRSEMVNYEGGMAMVAPLDDSFKNRF